MIHHFLVYSVILVGLAFWCDGFELQIKPYRARILNVATPVTVTCNTSVPLTVCQWSLLSSNAATTKLIDLSQGAESPSDPAQIDSALVGYSYSGRGLENGDCGISLELHTEAWLVSCRVKAASGWMYQWMEVDATRWSPARARVTSVPHSPAEIDHQLIPPREVIVLPGKETKILMEHRRRLEGCSFVVAGQSFNFWNGSQSRQSKDRHLYHGTGLRSGQCGIDIRDIREEDNGLLWGKISRTKNVENRLKPLIVARTPSHPRLTINYTENIIIATCLVEDSRPLPNFIWFLGSEQFTGPVKDALPGEPDAPWRWPWSNGSSAQRIRFEARPEHEGKMLKCIVTHEALKPLYLAAVEVVMALGAPVERFLPQFIVCGLRKSTHGTGLIAGGKATAIGEFPWHVGIYRKNYDSFEQQCGGTLITPSIVISAAHCFWSSATGNQTDISLYRVVGGIVSRNWETEHPGRQARELLRVDTNCFSGRTRNLAIDIALVFLKDPMAMTDTVGLVCMDWTSRIVLEKGNEGVVAGWGFTESGTPSQDLLYIDLPYVPWEDCRKSLPSYQNSLLTLDKFCAGFAGEAKSVCPGDSGGGLVVRDNVTSRHFLKGIVSLDFRPTHFDGCYSEHYTAFTKTDRYIEWIQEQISKP